jgi:Mg2+-importing ATPase
MSYPSSDSDPGLATYWALSSSQILQRLDSSETGLSSESAASRLRRVGNNALKEERRLSRASVLWKQIKSPLLLLLLFAAAISGASGEWTDAIVVAAIVLVTVGVGFRREYDAESAAAALRARVKTRVRALRDGEARSIPIEHVVPGDVVLLSAGGVVPADGLVIEATDLHVSEAVLTGESFPVEKQVGTLSASTPLAKRTNCVFLGTNVRSGTARCVIVQTGPATAFGSVAHRLSLKPPETEFDRGIRHFGYLLTSAMSFMVLLVFATHALYGRRRSRRCCSRSPWRSASVRSSCRRS